VVSPEIETFRSGSTCRIVVRGKGAVVSPEIETLFYHFKQSIPTRVARERWSRLRLKPCDNHRQDEEIPRWQGSGGLA